MVKSNSRFFALTGALILWAVAPNLQALPASPMLISPASNAVDVSVSPVLKIGIAEPGGDKSKVTFYGSSAPPAPGRDFTVVVLPDTQYYVSSKHGGTPSMFYSQTDWIYTNRNAWNIAFAIQLGDCVEDGDTNAGPNNITEWRNATNALYRLEKSDGLIHPQGIPYGVAVGNHDQSPNGDAAGTSSYFNQYFGVSHFSSHSYYGGHYGTNNDNFYDFFSASGLDFIVVFLEYDTGANPAVLAWANDVLKTNANRRAIVVSHYLIGNGNQSGFGAQGQAIYTALKTNANLFLMLCGHIGDNGEGIRVDNFNGHTVTTLLSDYQSRTNGGNGLMRLMTFSPSNNVIQVKTFSPWINQYETDADSQFTLPYSMQSSPNFAPIATNSDVFSGANSSAIWPGLQAGSTYKWYAKVTDGLGNSIIGPTWQFTTGTANIPPTTGDETVDVPGDFSTNIILNASDANSDSLTFVLDTLPAHGLVQSFDSTNGALVYVPAHGFSGTDSFSFHANDGKSDSAEATITLNVIAPVDANGNGIPDYWEKLYQINNATADEDGDGQGNLQEYLANTDPTSADSVFKIKQAAFDSSNHFVMTWSATGGTRYRIQRCNVDSNGGLSGRFVDVVQSATNEINLAPIGANSVQSFIDGTGSSGNGCFYRVKIIR